MDFFSNFGDNEPSFTRSLSALFSINKKLFKDFVKKTTSEQLRQQDLNSLSIKPEVSEKDSRYDIYCEMDNYIIIVEAKIGSNEVYQDQIDKYANNLKYERRKRIIITLTECDQTKLNDCGNTKIYYAKWLDIWELLGNNEFEIDINRCFQEYMEKKLMKAYDIDIWAVKVGDEQYENFKKGFYFNSYKHSPKMIGLRENIKSIGKVGIQRLYPVLDVIDCNSKELKKIIKENKLKMWPNWEEYPPYLYILGKELKLENPINKTFKAMQKSFVSIKFDEL